MTREQFEFGEFFEAHIPLIGYIQNMQFGPLPWNTSVAGIIKSGDEIICVVDHIHDEGFTGKADGTKHGGLKGLILLSIPFRELKMQNKKYEN